ncbi:MAG: hypothetical protein HKO59_02090 [Phycisphaerales bacterium]|nr:hypothetical protein [Phycisphaerae bacterium]NNF44114.1 hypothetical protein [Phycisphaerales bacterium]NNM24772.1 hypothetical protein [Phycisphaerales bacterium]
MSRTVFGLLAAGVLALVVSPALAQDGGRRGQRQRGGMGGFGGFARMLEPDFLRRDLTMITDTFDLDEDQRPIAETILFDYESGFSEASEAMRARFSELRPGSNQTDEQRQQRREVFTEFRDIRNANRELRQQLEAAEGDEARRAELEANAEALRAKMDVLREKMTEMRPRMPQGEELADLQDAMRGMALEWRQTRAQLRSQFLNNLQAILAETQQAKFPAFEQMHRREKALPHGRLAGERVSLFHVLEDVDLEPTGRLEEVMSAYAGALDAAIVARDRALESQQLDMMSAFMNREMDRVVNLMRTEADARVAVRNVNDQYVDIVASTLAADETTAGRVSPFRIAYQRRAFPRVFRTTSTERAFEAAKTIEDVSDESLMALISMEEGYLSELESINRELVQVTRDYEPDQAAERMARRADRFRQSGGERGAFGFGRGGDTPPDPIETAYQKRTELDKRYRSEIELLLTPEQIAELPPPPRERRQRAQRGGGGGDDTERRQRMIQRFDTNGDGQLSESEIRAAREGRRGRDDGGRRQGRGDR